MRLIEWLLEQIFPSRCIGCGRLSPDGICEACRSVLPFVGEHPCPKCGRESSWCFCGREFTDAGGEKGAFRYAPEYQQLTAPFYYEGLVRKGIGALKFHGQKRQARWMGREMARAVQKQMDPAMLDGVVPVPLSRSRRRERGYNQAGLLAQEVAAALELPLEDGLLVKVKNNATQHTLSRNERLTNVAGVYEASQEAAGKRLLVIDDVSTSGATLSSCGHALYLAGAEAVVCCTAAVTK